MKRNYIKDYIDSLYIPNYHHVSLSNGYLKLCYQNLCLCGDNVFNHFDKISVVNIKKFKLNNESVKIVIDRFIENAKERCKTRPYQIQILNDIENIDYVNIFDFNYSDEGLKDRWLNGEGRCDY